ncbi:hypothetical protein [Actinoplanes auranticolor]|uniref:Uncharacterized protein n=1 Tax=Actinoplanes auranticolor TaxID=47988 RepID=A0A919S984_9ACTN|nr:hypothetical protein [Actinoplanes auranticolor]GIM67085.1 hypothetical protein Aau02nite_25840 [Actinoplanes auranticolor]
MTFVTGVAGMTFATGVVVVTGVAAVVVVAGVVIVDCRDRTPGPALTVRCIHRRHLQE